MIAKRSLRLSWRLLEWLNLFGKPEIFDCLVVSTNCLTRNFMPHWEYISCLGLAIIAVTYICTSCCSLISCFAMHSLMLAAALRISIAVYDIHTNTRQQHTSPLQLDLPTRYASQVGLKIVAVLYLMSCKPYDNQRCRMSRQCAKRCIETIRSECINMIDNGSDSQRCQADHIWLELGMRTYRLKVWRGATVFLGRPCSTIGGGQIGGGLCRQWSQSSHQMLMEHQDCFGVAFHCGHNKHKLLFKCFWNCGHKWEEHLH